MNQAFPPGQGSVSVESLSLLLRRLGMQPASAKFIITDEF